MGTRGWRVYRHKGWWFILYVHYDAYPEGLGFDLLRDIPKDPDEFRVWLAEMRRAHDFELEEYKPDEQDDDVEDYDGRYTITRTRPNRNNTGIDWIYEIDLDNLAFIVNNCPMYRLDHMPPEDVFVRGMAVDHYGHRALSATTPLEYRYLASSPSLDPGRALTPPLALEPGDSMTLPVVSACFPVHELLNVPSRITEREATREVLFQTIIGTFLSSKSRHEDANFVNWLDSYKERRDLPEEARIAAYQWMGHFFAPDLSWDLDPPGDLLSLIWLRADVFFWLTTGFSSPGVVEQEAKACLEKLDTRIKKGTIFGFLCSIRDVVFLRIEITEEGITYKRSPILQFLPAPFALTPSTAGINAIARLSAQPNTHFMLRKAISLESAMPLHSLRMNRPTEQLFPSTIWVKIAAKLYEVTDLISLGRSTRQCLLAVSDTLQDLRIGNLTVRKPIDPRWDPFPEAAQTEDSLDAAKQSLENALDPFSLLRARRLLRRERTELFHAAFLVSGPNGDEELHCTTPSIARALTDPWSGHGAIDATVSNDISLSYVTCLLYPCMSPATMKHDPEAQLDELLPSST